MEKISINQDEAIKIAEEHIKSHGLGIKLTDVELVSDNDNTKLIYYFTSEGEAEDLRELAKDLASTYKIRIELREVTS